MLLIFGTLMHTEIIVFPCLGFDKNTRKALDELTAASSQHVVNDKVKFLGDSNPSSEDYLKDKDTVQ